jgi:uncharacterized protein YjdB
MHVLRGLSVVALIAAAGLAACKEATDPEPVASIVGMNPTDSVRLGKTITFQIETRDAKGNKLTGRKVTWSSLNPNVATVDANGTVTGIVIGSTIITARADGATSQTDVKVQPLVASVVLSPSSATVPIGSNRALTVTVSDKNGLALAGRAVAFSSSNPNIATVNSSGVVVGVSVGRAVINAEAIQDQVSGTATIDVVQLMGRPVRMFGGLLPSRSVADSCSVRPWKTVCAPAGEIETLATGAWTTSIVAVPLTWS